MTSVLGGLLGAGLLLLLLFLWAYTSSRVRADTDETSTPVIHGRRLLASGVLAPEAPRDRDIPTTAPTASALEQPDAPPYPCIRCGRCIEACPRTLNPAMLGLLARKGRYAEMHRYYCLDICGECGRCAEGCPARIPLIHLFRMARDAHNSPGSDA